MKVLLPFDQHGSSLIEIFRHALIYPILLDEGMSKKMLEKGYQVDQIAIKPSY